MTLEVVEYKSIAFREGAYTVRTIDHAAEHAQAFALRHKVFAQVLKWVPSAPDALEIDEYDDSSVSLGLYTEDDRLVGVARLLPPSGPFMLEREFRCFLADGHAVRKEADTIEITRLAIDPDVMDKGLSSKMMLALFKGIYQWCTANDVRYCYMEVEQRFLRVLRMIGFPCQPICSPMALPPAEALSVAALLDWEEFRIEAADRRPEFLAWITRAGRDSTACVGAPAVGGVGPRRRARMSRIDAVAPAAGAAA